MKLINYEKYAKRWSPRGTIVLLVVEAFSAGLFFGAGIIDLAAKHDSWGVAFEFSMAFGAAVGVLGAALVALHYCRSAQAERMSLAAK